MKNQESSKRKRGRQLRSSELVRCVPFKCEACEMEGSVKDPALMESVSCPICGARYLHWPDGKWKCVVRPIFAPNDLRQLPPG